jgi:sulfane dehydrogenase subunit SoxC
MALTRFRMAWRWSGGPAILQSRATDETGYVQPSRNELITKRGTKAFFHFNAVTSWGVAETGEVKHVYA